jgi:hypothetical protein
MRCTGGSPAKTNADQPTSSNRSLSMNGHLLRCRFASGAHVRPSTLRSGARGALHLTHS